MAHLFSGVKDGTNSPAVAVQSNNKSKTISLFATNAFCGDLSKQQLTFPAGAKIVAHAGQDENSWWWGRCVNTNQKGWFPPSYTAVPLAKQDTSSVDPSLQAPSPIKRNENNGVQVMGGVCMASSSGMRTMTNPNLRNKHPDEKLEEGEDEEGVAEFDVSSNRKGSGTSIVKGIKKGSKKLNLSRFTKKRGGRDKKRESEPRRLFQRRVAVEDPLVPKVTVVDHQPGGLAQP